MATGNKDAKAYAFSQPFVVADSRQFHIYRGEWWEILKRVTAEPRKGHFLSDIYQKRNWNKEIRTEIKTKNISFNRLIISFKRYNKSLKRYNIEWKLKQEKQNGN